MRCEVTPSEDTTTLFLRWEIIAEGKEPELLRELGGPLMLELDATNYVDVGGKFHEATTVEILVHPFAGPRNFGQAKFTDFESRRAFWETLQDSVTGIVANFIYDAAPGSVEVGGKVLRPATA